ncbi:MAG: type II secretion system F family protein [Actinomycetes bacterium]
MNVLVCLIGAIGILLIMQAKNDSPKWNLPKLQKRISTQVQWPELVDDLASGVRAGLSLPQAMTALFDQVPTEIRPALELMLSNYRLTGDFNTSMLEFANTVKDPVADQFVAALVLANDLGGAELASLLRVLAENLRTQSALSGEIKARQSWTINGAKLAIAAPWLTVGVLSTRADARATYLTSGGIRLLEICLLVSLVAYWLMKRIGQLPRTSRILGPS